MLVSAGKDANGISLQISYEERRPVSAETRYAIAYAYLETKRLLLMAGGADEIAWQQSRGLDVLTEETFLREAAWAILSAGLSETVVRSKFDAISAAFLEWRSAREIVRFEEACCRKALAAFKHQRKVLSIVAVAKTIATEPFGEIKERVLRDGMSYICGLPGLGPVTRLHFAKNLGIDVAKPDRHLCRLAAACGYTDPASLCRDISEITCDRVSVIDLVLWRYATLNRDYENRFRRSMHMVTPHGRGLATPGGRQSSLQVIKLRPEKSG